MAPEFAEKLKALNSICESEEDIAFSSSVLRNWLEGQAVSPVVLWKDQYGKVTGAGIDLVCNRVCPQYFNTGFMCGRVIVNDCMFVNIFWNVPAMVNVAVLTTSLTNLTEKGQNVLDSTTFQINLSDGLFVTVSLKFVFCI